MFAETRETETMLGPVVQAGLEAIKVNYLFSQFSCKQIKCYVI